MEERLSKSSDGRNMSSHGGRPSKAELIAQMFAGQGICGEASGAWDKADAGKDLGHPADENVDPAAFALYRDNVMTLAELDSVPASSSPFTASIPSASISYLAPFSTPMRHITIAKPADLSFLQDLQEKLKSFTITTPKPAHVLQQQRDAQFDLYASPAFNKLLQENKECDEQVERLRQEEEEAKKRKKKDPFPPLTAEILEFVKRCTGPGPNPVVSGFSVDLTREDIRTLDPKTWLNDEIINFYGQLMMDRAKRNPDQYPKIHFFNTFFYETLKKGYAGVRRWTKKFDLFSLDYVIIPVHMGMHWCCSVINFRLKRIEYYDSLYGGNALLFRLYRGYLQAESQDKRKKPFDFDEWTDYCPKDIPGQENGHDCGVFTCMFAEYASRGADFDFAQRHMSYLRQRMVYEICTKKLLVQ